MKYFYLGKGKIHKFSMFCYNQWSLFYCHFSSWETPTEIKNRIHCISYFSVSRRGGEGDVYLCSRPATGCRYWRENSSGNPEGRLLFRRNFHSEHGNCRWGKYCLSNVCIDLYLSSQATDGLPVSALLVTVTCLSSVKLTCGTSWRTTRPPGSA